MQRKEIAEQTRVENGMLKYLVEGLRKVHGPDYSRKLSTLRFITQSFQRHLEHMMSLEETNGYMDMVLTTAPQLGRSVDALRKDHEWFRSALGSIASRLERLAPTDAAALADVSQDLHNLLHKLDEHSKKEADLVLEAIERDEGGEG
jgi:iron-sulfur cluster repair protein YtfE (RIC family)